MSTSAHQPSRIRPRPFGRIHGLLSRSTAWPPDATDRTRVASPAAPTPAQTPDIVVSLDRKSVDRMLAAITASLGQRHQPVAGTVQLAEILDELLGTLGTRRPATVVRRLAGPTSPEVWQIRAGGLDGVARLALGRLVMGLPVDLVATGALGAEAAS